MMRRWICFLVLVGIAVLSGIGPATARPASPAADSFVQTRVLYAPTMPFHITDIRPDPTGDPVLYEDKSDFETRTVTILQPYRSGQPLTDRPVVFFVHGGGWTDGYAAWYTDLLTPTLVLEMGWVVVNVDYRLTSDQVFLADAHCPSRELCDEANATKAAWYPDNLQDVALAFDWTVQNITAYGGDRQNIFMFGHSAGAHLVSLLATHPDYRALRPSMRGVISMSGAYLLKDLNMSIFGAAIDQTFHGGHTGNDAVLGEASPAAYALLGETLPPFYILHCQFDLPSLPDQAISFRSRLETLGLDVDWDYLLSYSHESEMTAIADANEAVTQQIVEYIQSHVRKTVHLPLILR